MFDECCLSINAENKLQQEDKYWRYISLVKAALAGNWEIAERFLDQNKTALRVPITKSLETALHIAVGTGKARNGKAQNFVKKLVESMPLEALELCDDKGYTALHTAAWVGNTAAAMVLVQTHPALLHIRANYNRLPIHVAAMYGRKDSKDTLSYLLRVTKDDPPKNDPQVSKRYPAYKNQSGIWLLTYIITSEFFDVALDLIHRYPKLATTRIQLKKPADTKVRAGPTSALANLAMKVSAFPSGSRLNFWQWIIYSCIPVKVESCSKYHSRGDIEDPMNTSQILTNQKYNWARVLWANFCFFAHKVNQKLHFIHWKVFEFAGVSVKVESCSKDQSRGDIEDQISCSKSHSRGDIEDQMNTSPKLINEKYNWVRFLWANFCISAHKARQKLPFILRKVFEFAVPRMIKRIPEEKQKHYQALQLAKCLCKEIQSLNNSNYYESLAKGPLFTAAKLGVHEVVEEIVDSFPSLVWARDSDNYSIFHHAIVLRHENVFNLLYQMSEHKRVITVSIDKSNNTTLHWAGRLAPRNKLNLVPGAALQMQRELQWFEEVKKFVIPYYMHWQNNDEKTAEMVFTDAHKALVVEGEKWMKDTATSCTIAAALIATIAFAAAISVPGGNDDANGLPILSNETVFFVFAISNAFSLFTSTTSLVMFLSILTSTYAEKDFLFALPKRLIIGLVTLFFSITAMMIAFGSIVYLLFGYNKRWVLIPTVVFAGIPIISFVCLEFPLLLNLITSYGGGIFGKKSNRLFY
ncbi:ankyrin repeat family protein [Actinidia rufa]|uniref:Ankyrin repeat family protein n=1 Tax=Actinidia rufa TaxID=165716 RepID=A0A7J0DF28_9ERIC|nr:ankyrin repeat family protein [Actinidia rufa]